MIDPKQVHATISAALSEWAEQYETLHQQLAAALAEKDRLIAER